MKIETEQKFIAVFTSPQALNKWKKKDLPAWAAADTAAICSLALESGYALVHREGENNSDFIALHGRHFTVAKSRFPTLS